MYSTQQLNIALLWAIERLLSVQYLRAISPCKIFFSRTHELIK